MTIEKQSRFNVTRRMRLEGFDYRTPGFYFTTVCQRDRLSLFVDDVNGTWELTEPGEMVCAAILGLESRFPEVSVDTYAVMPNHVHLLIGLAVSVSAAERDSIIKVMHWWKTVTTTRYIQSVKSLNWPRFNKALWQEGYHDRIVRNERELDAIRNYIVENPTRWREDEFYP